MAGEQWQQGMEGRKNGAALRQQTTAQAQNRQTAYNAASAQREQWSASTQVGVVSQSVIPTSPAKAHTRDRWSVWRPPSRGDRHKYTWQEE